MAGAQVYTFDYWQLSNALSPRTISRALPSGVLRRIFLRHWSMYATGSGSILPSNITADVRLTTDAAGNDLIFRPWLKAQGDNALQNVPDVYVPREGLLWQGRLFLPPGLWAWVRWTNYDLGASHSVHAELEVET